jgi:uncharacterized protein
MQVRTTSSIRLKALLKNIFVFTLPILSAASCSVDTRTLDATQTESFDRGFPSGDIELACGLSCSGTFGYNRRSMRNHAEAGEWRTLASTVNAIGYNVNLAWYYLGRSAEEMGYHDAAVRYYNRVDHPTTTKCKRGCDGHIFPDEANARILFLGRMKSKMASSTNLPIGQISNSNDQMTLEADRSNYALRKEKIILLAEAANPKQQNNYPRPEDFQAGLRAYQSKSYSEAIRIWTLLAEEGSAKAQFNLAKMHYRGYGVPKSTPLAVSWFRRAAELGHTEAQIRLGGFLQHGVGVAKDRSQAMIWFRKAAGKGNTKAQVQLGGLNWEGKNFEAAAKWYRMAAKRGDVTGQVLLAVLYKSGTGVPQSDVKAMKWKRKAAAQGHKDSQYELGVAYHLGQSVKKDYDEAEMWYRKAAVNGHADAQQALSKLHGSRKTAAPQGEGSASKTDWKKWSAELKAHNKFGVSAKLGDPEAQFLYGQSYTKGNAIPRNNILASLWYGKAAVQGHVEAQYQYAGMWLMGRGVRESVRQAARWFHRAAEQGHVNAQNILGQMYFEGRGVKQDDHEAVKWFRKAADQGDIDSKQRLEDLVAELERIK